MGYNPNVMGYNPQVWVRVCGHGLGFQLDNEVLIALVEVLVNDDGDGGDDGEGDENVNFC